MAWPTVVPVVSPSEIRRDNIGDGKQCCLLGWLNVAFEGNPCYGESYNRSPEYLKAVKTILETAGVEPYHDGGIWSCSHQVADFNNDRRNSNRKVASVFNLAMKRLGYTVPCER